MNLYDTRKLYHIIPSNVNLFLPFLSGSEKNLLSFFAGLLILPKRYDKLES